MYDGPLESCPLLTFSVWPDPIGRDPSYMIDIRHAGLRVVVSFSAAWDFFSQALGEVDFADATINDVRQEVVYTHRDHRILSDEDHDRFNREVLALLGTNWTAEATRRLRERGVGEEGLLGFMYETVTKLQEIEERRREAAETYRIQQLRLQVEQGKAELARLEGAPT